MGELSKVVQSTYWVTLLSRYMDQNSMLTLLNVKEEQLVESHLNLFQYLVGQCLAETKP